MYNKLAVEVNEESSYVFIPSNGQWWFVFADDKISQSDTYTMSLLGVKASRCQRGSGAQHSSSASLMGGIKLLVDLHWLTWLMERVFTGLICMVLRWVFSGSSVNHVFSWPTLFILVAFCLSRESLLLVRLVRLVVGIEWTEELFLLEEWDEWEEWERLVRDWPALWSNCIRQNIRSEGTSSNAYGGLVMTYRLVHWLCEFRCASRNR